MVFNLERRRVGRRDPCAPARHVRRVAPACRHWRTEAKAKNGTYGRLINTATGLLLYGGAGQSNYVAAKAGIQAFTEAIATEMAPYGVTANTIMPGANTRLARDRLAHGAHVDAGPTRCRRPRFDPRDPVHVGEFGAYLASPDAGWISGQTFQVRGGTVEHVETWSVRDTARGRARIHRRRLPREIPRLFGAAAKRADPPPAGWKAR